MINMIIKVANMKHLLSYQTLFLSDSQVLTHLILIKKKSHKMYCYPHFTDK